MSKVESEIAERAARLIQQMRLSSCDDENCPRCILATKSVVERAIEESRGQPRALAKPAHYEDMKLDLVCAVSQGVGIDRKFSPYLDYMVAEGLVRCGYIWELTESGEALLPDPPKGNENV